MSNQQKQLRWSTGSTTGNVGADLYSETVAANGSYELHVQVEVSNAGTPAGSWYLQEKLLGTSTWVDVPLATVSLPASAAGVSHTADATAIVCTGNAGSGTSVFKFAVAGTGSTYRLFWDFTSGTGATAAQAWILTKQDA
jgi:hypothetical protein